MSRGARACCSAPTFGTHLKGATPAFHRKSEAVGDCLFYACSSGDAIAPRLPPLPTRTEIARAMFRNRTGAPLRLRIRASPRPPRAYRTGQHRSFRRRAPRRTAHVGRHSDRARHDPLRFSSPTAARRPDVELLYQAGELGRLLTQRVARRRRFFDHCGILLGRPIHAFDRLVDLADSVRLLGGAGCNLGHYGVDLGDLPGDPLQGDARLRDEPGRSIHAHQPASDERERGTAGAARHVEHRYARPEPQDFRLLVRAAPAFLTQVFPESLDAHFGSQSAKEPRVLRAVESIASAPE